MSAFARPVRIFARSRRSEPSTFSMEAFKSSSVSWSIVSSGEPSLFVVLDDERAHVLPEHDPPDVATGRKREYADRESIVPAERDRRGVHHADAIDEEA